MSASLGDGWLRGLFGTEVTPELALQIGKLASERCDGPVAVACDTRPSGESLKRAVMAGIMSQGKNAIDLGQLPTSALQYYVKTHDNVAGGVMVTASHSPSDYNGFKFIAGSGRDEPLLAGMTVESIMAKKIPQVPWANIGEVGDVETDMGRYIDDIIADLDMAVISGKKLKIAVECAHGSCTRAVTKLLSKIGVEYLIIDGSARGELTGVDSELTAENLKELGNVTRHTKCDFGVAFDTDADRCLFVTGNGDMVTGDKSMCILARTCIDRRKGKIVTSVATPSSVEHFATAQGCMVMLCQVGAPTVVRKVDEYEAIFGGEINGGCIFPDFQMCRDAIMALGRMVEAVCKYGPLADQAAAIKDCNYVTASVPCPDEKREAVQTAMKEMVGSRNRDTTDGCKIFDDDGWFLVRPSDTDHLIRVYTEYDDMAKARAKADELVALIKEAIGA